MVTIRGLDDQRAYCAKVLKVRFKLVSLLSHMWSLAFLASGRSRSGAEDSSLLMTLACCLEVPTRASDCAATYILIGIGDTNGSFRIEIGTTGIISSAIANAERAPASGQENVAGLPQHRSMSSKSTPSAAQFTFTCDSQVPGTIPWPGMLTPCSRLA